jgi:hypothetical protein
VGQTYIKEEIINRKMSKYMTQVWSQIERLSIYSKSATLTGIAKNWLKKLKIDHTTTKKVSTGLKKKVNNTWDSVTYFFTESNLQ